MKIIQLDRDTKKFRRDIAHIVGDSGLLRLWGYRLYANAKAAYAAHADTGHMAQSVHMSRVNSKEGVPVDYEIWVDDPGAAKVEWGHYSGRRTTPMKYRYWVPGRHILRNSLPGGAKAWKRIAKDGRRKKAAADRSRAAAKGLSTSRAGRRVAAKRARRRR